MRLLKIKNIGPMLCLLVCSGFMNPSIALAQLANEASEPTVDGSGAIDLLEGGTLNAWDVPSDLWYVEGGSIVADTGTEKLEKPEWLYSKQRFGDFVFTCELRLTGDDHRNTGIYYRANVIQFQSYNNKERTFEAPSGYEFDAAFLMPGKPNKWGSLGDWYARPSLRIRPDPSIIDDVYEAEEWNRLTIRALGNRLEHWINGIKVMDYVDTDPAASRAGIIGFQIHNGSVMKMEYRNIRVLPLAPALD